MALTDSLPTEDAGGLSITDTRLVLAGLIARDTAGAPRLGVLPWHGNALVTGTTGMSYSVGQFAAATSRNGAGVELVANDAATTVATTAAPGANSRIDVIWVRCRFPTYTDAGQTTPTFGVTQGVASGSPVKPAIPAGALELATAVISSSTTRTDTGVVITQTAPFTAAAGGVVWLRSQTEQDAWTPPNGAVAYRLDLGRQVVRSAGSWVYWGEKSAEVAGTASGSLLVADGWVDLGGQITIPASPFGPGVGYEVDAKAISTATVSSGGGFTLRIVQGGSSLLSHGGVTQQFPAAGQTVFHTEGRHVVPAGGSVTLKAQISSYVSTATVDSSNANLSGLWVTIRPRVAI